jgi:hypothetical protein
MSNHVSRFTATLSCVAAIALAASTASATPAIHALALKNAAPSDVETVRWGWGWGLGGFAAGAIIGGALAAPYYYGPRYYYSSPYYPAYAPYPAYPAPYPAPYPPQGYYQGPAGGGDVGYCQQRYRSYDPRSGTFLGSDGQRHHCP